MNSSVHRSRAQRLVGHLLPLLASLLFTLSADPARAHGGHHHAHEVAPALAGAATARRLPDGTLFVPKAMQHRLGLRTSSVDIVALRETVELNGIVVADAAAGGRVQAAQAGRVEAGAQGLPVLGQRVRQGQVLAWLHPTLDSAQRADRRAELAELDARLAVAAARVQRYAQLEGVVPGKDIEAAHIELDALQRRRAALAGGLEGAEPLRAPIAGVIAATHVVAGQIVDARELLYEVIDPARLAVEVPAYDPALIDDIAAASAELAGGVLPLEFVGAGRRLRAQAMPLLLRMRASAKPTVTPGVGQPVRVIIQRARTVSGAAVPRAALLRDGGGEPMVWVKVAPERFEPRRVRAHALDATTVAITDGVAAGERVVGAGASLLAQVR